MGRVWWYPREMKSRERMQVYRRESMGLSEKEIAFVSALHGKGITQFTWVAKSEKRCVVCGREGVDAEVMKASWSEPRGYHVECGLKV